MDNNQIQRDYEKSSKAAYHDVSATSFLLVFFPLSFVFIIGGFLLLSNFFGNLIAILGIFGIVLFMLLIRTIEQAKTERQYFQKDEIHTHDDDCYACGDSDMYGTQSPWGPPDPAQYVCRHSSGPIST